MPNIGAKNLPMDQTDQKRARSKFFSLDAWRVFGPPSVKKKNLIHAQTCPEQLLQFPYNGKIERPLVAHVERKKSF